MARKGNKTGRWAQRHVNDPWVKKATSQGYRSRAVFKLQEIDQQDKLVRSGSVIVDLGSAPGGWSQYIARKYGDRVSVIAIDLLQMQPVDGVDFIQGDFEETAVLSKVDEVLAGRQVDLVISDMAPNITGIRDVDEARFENLLDAVLHFCQQRLRPGGNLLVKLFEGSAAHSFRRNVKPMFASGAVRKPAASRSESREYYFVARQFKA